MLLYNLWELFCFPLSKIWKRQINKLICSFLTTESAAKNIASNYKVFSEYWICKDDTGSSRQDTPYTRLDNNPDPFV